MLDEGCPPPPEYNVSAMLCARSCGMCKPGGDGVDSGAIVGGVLGVLVAMAVAALVLYARHRGAMRRAEANAEEDHQASDPQAKLRNFV